MAAEEEKAFLDQMARTLDLSMKKLEEEEKRLVLLLGEDRAKELFSYWSGEFDATDMEEMRRTFDFDDRMLISTWIRLKRNRARRAMAGRGVMILNSGRADLEIAPPGYKPKKD
jgi:hypothetical protein